MHVRIRVYILYAHMSHIVYRCRNCKEHQQHVIVNSGGVQHLAGGLRESGTIGFMSIIYSRSFNEFSCPTFPSIWRASPRACCPHPIYTDPDKSESHTAKATIATGCIESDHVMNGGHGDVLKI